MKKMKYPNNKIVASTISNDKPFGFGMGIQQLHKLINDGKQTIVIDVGASYKSISKGDTDKSK